MDMNPTETAMNGVQTWDMSMYIPLTIMCLVFLIIMTGNILTIMAFKKFHSLRTVRNYFLVSVAAGDILHGIVTMHNLMYAVLPSDYVITNWADPGLSAATTSELITSILSYLHILVITFDCFICILKPLHYHQLMSPKRAKLIIVSTWIGSFLLGSVYLLKEINISEGKRSPRVEIYNTLIRIVIWVAVVIAIIVMYWKIFAMVHKQKRQICELRQTSTIDNKTENIIQHRANKKKGIKRVVMVFVLIIAFILLWLPHMISFIIYNFYADIFTYGIGIYRTITFYVMFTTLALSNSAVNAFIYARSDRDFRHAYKQILQCNKA